MSKTIKISVKVNTALEKSISKWEAIVEGTKKDKGYENCALCKMFCNDTQDILDDCIGCPIYEDTGVINCNFKQYKDWRHTCLNTKKNGYGKVGDSYEAKLAAQDMLEYLLDLYWRCKVR